MANFRFFQDGGRRQLGFLTFRINSAMNQEGQTASPCEISWQSVKQLPRYGDFSIFQNGDRRHLGFLKFHTFKSVGSKGSNWNKLSNF